MGVLYAEKCKFSYYPFFIKYFIKIAINKNFIIIFFHVDEVFLYNKQWYHRNNI